MALHLENIKGGFAFTWRIYNFSYNIQKKSEYLESPRFEVKSMEEDTWYLRLYPRGNSTHTFVTYYLRRDIGKSVINYILYVKASNGQLVTKTGSQTLNRNDDASKECVFSLNLCDLKGSNPSLDNDTLTLCCHMWKNENDLSELVMCYADTKINVTKLYFKWILNELVDGNASNSSAMHRKFNQSKIINYFSPEIPDFTIRLLYGRALGDETIYFGIEKAGETETLFLKCIIHLLDFKGIVAHSVKDEYLFKYSHKIHCRTFPLLSKCKLLSKEKVYLPNGRLTLRCEIYVSKGEVNSVIKRFECYGTDDPMSHDRPTLSTFQKQAPEFSELWKENLQHFYEGSKFTDVFVRTPNKQFPVHKAVICAQSEVFSAMFERDMEESRTGVVKIEDLDDETVSKMLMFLYANTLEDLDFTMTCKLYFAADKYRITALHRKCVNFLKCNLDTSNVCGVLELADTHRDQELKLTAGDFIFRHDYEIMNSEEWKKLMESKSYLTSEMMHLMICKRIMI